MIQALLRSATTWAYESRLSPTRRWRMARIEAFLGLARPPAGARIVDLGGTPYMWELFDHDFEVTLVNLPAGNPGPRSDRYTWVEADACDLDAVFADNEFDLAFSNSVIEHVGPEDRQAAFAAGIRRIAPSYWVQTPSPRFPVEAHTGVPFYWQRSERQRRRRLDRWYRTMPVWAEMIENTRVLGTGRMHQLFPDGQLWRERLAGIEKSLCMYRPGDATLRRARLADPV